MKPRLWARAAQALVGTLLAFAAVAPLRASPFSDTSLRRLAGSTATVPGAPVLLPIENGDGDPEYLVDWTDVPEATGYTLEEDEEVGFASPLVRYQGPDSLLGILYQPLGTYYYRVRASGAGGDGPWSNVEAVIVSWWLRAPAMDPIRNPDGDGDYVVQWSYVRHAQVYHLEQDGDPAFPSPVLLYVGPDLSCDVTGQSPGAWYYRVRAEGSGGIGAWSNVEPVIAWPSGICALPMVARDR